MDNDAEKMLPKNDDVDLCIVVGTPVAIGKIFFTISKTRGKFLKSENIVHFLILCYR
jgi:hypothetical protein